MPFIKTIQRILLDDRRQITFTIADSASGANSGHLVVGVSLANDGIFGDSMSYIVTGPNQNAGLTAGERTALVSILSKIYNTAKADAGYVDGYVDGYV